MQKSHGIDFYPSYDIIRNGVIIEHREDNIDLPQESKIIIQNPKRPEHNVIELPFRSFLGNAYRFLARGFGLPMSALHTDGGTSFYAGGNNALASGRDYSGIQVGTGNSATTPNTYCLDALIMEGTFTKATTIRNIPTGIGSTRTIRFTRNMINATAGDVSVAELGLSIATNPSDLINASFMLTRDVFSSPVVIASADSRNFRIDISVTKNATKSFSENYLKGFYNNFNPSTMLDLIDTDGTVAQPESTNKSGFYEQGGSPTYRFGASAGDSTFGILVGTGSTAPDYADLSCGVTIPHSANFSYGSCKSGDSGYAFTDATIDGQDTYFIANRQFINVSLGSTTIKEYAIVSDFSSGSTPGRMLCRGLINGGTGVTLKNGDILVLYVKFKLTS